MNQADCGALDLDGVISCRMGISSASAPAILTPLKAARREHPGKGHEKWAPSLPDIFCMYWHLLGGGRGVGWGFQGGMAKISSIGSQHRRLKTKQTAISGQHNLTTWLISSFSS